MAAQDAQLLSAITRALCKAWEAGSPVVGPGHERWAKIAHVALRHIQGFDRRGVNPHDGARAVPDLAKGLVAAFEKDPRLVGALIPDYQKVAEKLLRAYISIPQPRPQWPLT